jgi:hypothetical protein
MGRVRPAAGTGSWPPGWKGVQRSSRRAASQAPASAPCVRTASAAKREQVGEYRQLQFEPNTTGSMGESVSW